MKRLLVLPLIGIGGVAGLGSIILHDVDHLMHAIAQRIAPDDW